MVCTGYYKKSDGQYSLIVDYKDSKNIVVYVGSDNTIVSAFKLVNGDKYAYSSKLAESVYETIKLGMSGATSKNGEPVSFKLGGSSLHSFKKKGVSFELQKFNNVPVYLLSDDGSSGICMNYSEETMVHPTLDYVKMNSQKVKTSLDSIGVDEVRVKSLEEVALEKDTSWLNGKKYYIVNDSATAEKLFSQIENYNGILSFDYETTGLKINMFGQYGSKRKQELEEYNEKNPNSKIEVDKVVGFIYSVKENVAYYFPVGHRKFKNLYEDMDETTLKTINNIMARYTVGDFRDLQSSYAKFIRSLSVEEFTPDIILMERNRDILQKKNILAHNGSFEYKVSLLYDIDLNLKEDSMLLHQLMYKFRSIRSSKSEPSNLKYLTKVELGVDQLELVDFFPDFKPDKTGTVRGNKQSSIDFSYMDYDSAKAYAPADGDFTLQIWKKYKKDMQLNFPEMEYIYNVEVIVSMAIGYMEFYGLRIDEVKIEQTRQKYLYDMLMTEYKIRESVGYVQKDEEEVYNAIVAINKELENAEEKEELYGKRDSLCDRLRSLIANSSKAINLNAPAQVSDLLYNKLNYPHPEGELSVKKNVIKGLTKAKNEDGTAKYPVAIYYRDYKDLSSLITKFFGRLQDFMYPSGFFFSSFGQISTATGRMSCLDEDTLVTTVGGVKKIKDVEVGDLVYCYNTDGSVRIKPVLNVIYKGYKECIELKWFSSGNGNTGSLICTPDHRIKTKHHGWVQAKDCLNKKVYHLHRSSEERPRDSVCVIDSIQQVGKRNVYDLEIEGIHNFIANELCVHNCSRPNAQQLPKSVTKIIVPRDNYCTIDADFSQIEYRTLTAMAKEEKLIESFRDPDSDYHTTMASLMYQVPYASVAPDMRSSAKSFNFGIPYGMGFKSLSILLFGDASPSHVAKAMELYELYFKDQPNVRKFFDKVKEVAGIYKFNKTRFNRRRYYNFEDAEGNYSEAKKAMALRQAGNFVIQGSAADIFKIAVARNFMFIRDNKLFGKLLITNMVHDEMLFEVDCDTLNIKKILSEIVKNMEFKIDGFPPLYVGAGVALSWAEAKGKMAEIHPVLANTYIAESENDSLYVPSPVSSKSVKEYFDKRVFEFRVNKVSDYVKDESNYNKAIEPAIGNLLGLQFDFGVAKEFAKEYTEDNGYTKEEIANKMRLIPLEQLRRFIDEYNLGVDYKLFGGVDLHEEEEEEEGYDDVDENELEEENDDVGGVFALIDESDVPYGISVQDLIRQFGLVVSKELGICGIDLTKVKKSKKDELISLLESSTCNSTDEGALNLVFLNYNNVLNRTDIYVKDLVTSSVATRLGINAFA
jgi:DNA polymerase I-like protein with 3'-5' exonuclease and polymerase domains